MKKSVLLILSLICAVLLLSCNKSNDPVPAIQAGTYTIEDNSTGAYLYFDTANTRWQSGAGIAVSYAVAGEYRTTGTQIVATSDDGQVQITLDVAANGSLSVRSLKNELDGVSFWISPGDNFLPPHE
jgi:major membrane immunogen (membrane-anchored lipoprotein)